MWLCPVNFFWLVITQYTTHKETSWANLEMFRTLKGITLMLTISVPIGTYSEQTSKYVSLPLAKWGNVGSDIMVQVVVEVACEGRELRLSGEASYACCWWNKRKVMITWKNICRAFIRALSILELWRKIIFEKRAMELYSIPNISGSTILILTSEV